MGVIKRGILGGFSGKIGNVVGSSWKGIAVIKSLPLSVANPQTTSQTTQRSKFANMVAVASALLSFLVKPFWDRYASQMSGYNAFIQANIDDMPSDTAGPFEDMILSEGPMTPLTGVSCAQVGVTAEFTVSYDDTTAGAYQSADDIIYIFGYDPDTGEYVYPLLNPTRADGEGSFTFSAVPDTPADVIYGCTARSTDGYRAGAELAKKVG